LILAAMFQVVGQKGIGKGQEILCQEGVNSESQGCWIYSNMTPILYYGNPDIRRVPIIVLLLP
jgi:hypothetical protein